MALSAYPVAYAVDVEKEVSGETATVAVAHRITAVYQDESGKEITKIEVSGLLAAEGDNIPATKLKVPEGYEITSIGQVEYIGGTSDGYWGCIVKVKSNEKVEPELIPVDIIFVDETKEVVGDTSRLLVMSDKTTIPATDIKGIPEGCEIVSVGDIDWENNKCVVTVKSTKPEEPELIPVDIIFVDETKEVVGDTSRLLVMSDKTTIPATDIKGIPEGYVIVSVGDIDWENNECVVTVKSTKPEEPETPNPNPDNGDDNDKPNRPRPSHKHHHSSSNNAKPVVVPSVVIKPTQNPSTGANI